MLHLAAMISFFFSRLSEGFLDITIFGQSRLTVTFAFLNKYLFLWNGCSFFFRVNINLPIANSITSCQSDCGNDWPSNKEKVFKV